MKKVLYFLIAFIIILPLKTYGLELDLYSKYAVIYDTKDQKVIYQKGEDVPVKIASLTKIMTVITAIENITNLDEEIIITLPMLSGIPWDASVAGLKVGDHLTYRDLLYAAILPSGADACFSLAYLISGNSDNFVELMNHNATKLNLKKTHFANVTGYDSTKTQTSSIEDVLTLLIYSLKNETFREIYTTKSYKMTNGKTINSTVSLYNKLYNFDLSTMIGSKTGYTTDAGMCISALIKVHNREFIAITLNAPVVPKTAYNLIDAKTILDSLQDNYEDNILFKKEDVLFKIPIKYSKEEYYEVSPREDVLKFIEKSNENRITYDYVGTSTLSFKNKKGTKIGHIKYILNGEIVKEEDIIQDRDFEISYKKFFLPKLFILVICLMLIFALFKTFKILRRHHKTAIFF